MTPQMIWPEIFINENFEYPDSTKRFGSAIADGLSGWGNCYAGAEIPENFGKGMAKIDEIVGVATPDELLEASDKFLEE